MATKISTEKRISKRFKAYDKSIRDAWEAYQFITHYLRVIHGQLKSAKDPGFKRVDLSSTQTKNVGIDDTYGVISHISTRINAQRTLIAAVSQSEVFLQYLVTEVLRDFPGKLSSANQTDQQVRDEKLVDVILSSNDKQEIIDRIIEEKVRSIFYGNPADFFLKDKGRLGFGDHFRSNLSPQVEKFIEIVARRNLLIHNEGRVDRKYLREAKNSSFKLEQRIPIDLPYLKESLFILRGLSATAGILVCQNTYSTNVPSGKMLDRYRGFNHSLKPLPKGTK